MKGLAVLLLVVISSVAPSAHYYYRLSWSAQVVLVPGGEWYGKYLVINATVVRMLNYTLNITAEGNYTRAVLEYAVHAVTFLGDRVIARGEITVELEDGRRTSVLRVVYSANPDKFAVDFFGGWAEFWNNSTALMYLSITARLYRGDEVVGVIQASTTEVSVLHISWYRAPPLGEERPRAEIVAWRGLVVASFAFTLSALVLSILALAGSVRRKRKSRHTYFGSLAHESLQYTSER